MERFNIKVIEAISITEIQRFVMFPFTLYGDNPYWTPPIIQEEIDTLDKSKNPVFKNAQSNYFLALNDGIFVGRVAVIINWVEVNQLKKKKVRF